MGIMGMMKECIDLWSMNRIIIDDVEKRRLIIKFNGSNVFRVCELSDKFVIVIFICCFFYLSL